MQTTKSSKRAGFSIAAVWFGSHCGGGFATGTLAANYYVKYGAWALFTPLIAVAIMVAVVVIQWEICRSNKAYNYRAFGDVLYRPQQKLWSTVFEIMFVVDVIMALAIVCSSAGNLIMGWVPVSYVGSVAIFVVIIVLLTMFGTKFLMRMGTLLSVLLIGCLIITSVAGLSGNTENFGRVISEWDVSTGFLPALWAAILYASFQCACLATTHVFTEELPDRKSVVWAGIFGFLLNGAMMILTCYMLLSYYPDHVTDNLPVYNILSMNFNQPLLLVAYSLALFLALVTTGITCSSALTARAEVYTARWIKNITTNRFVCNLVVMIVGFCVAQFGLLTILNKGYSFIGYICIPLVILPTLILGVSRFKKEELENTQS